MTLTIYHNPRCSKSRQTLQLLQEQNLAPQIVEYLKAPPTAEELGRILELLRLEPRELMRRQEPEYREHRLDDPALTRTQLIAAMVAHPKLIERPIVIRDGKAVLGRPPERILELF